MLNIVGGERYVSYIVNPTKDTITRIQAGDILVNISFLFL